MHFSIPAICLALSTLVSAVPTLRDESHLVPRRATSEAFSICAGKQNNGYQFNETLVDGRLDWSAETIVAGAPDWQSPAGCCAACESFDGCVQYQWGYNSYVRSNVCWLIMSSHPSSKGPQPSTHCPNGIFAVSVPFVTQNNVGSPIKAPNPTIGVSCAYPVSGGPPGSPMYHSYVN